MGGKPSDVITISIDTLEEGWDIVKSIVEEDIGVRKKSPETVTSFTLTHEHILIHET